MPRKERGRYIFKAMELMGGAGSKFAGYTTILSGTASIVVSATSVLSGRPILVTPQNYTVANTGNSLILGVSTVVPGVSFTISTNNTNTVAPVGVSFVIIR
jgi:hypothetical protein